MGNVESNWLVSEATSAYTTSIQLKLKVRFR